MVRVLTVRQTEEDRQTYRQTKALLIACGAPGFVCVSVCMQLFSVTAWLKSVQASSQTYLLVGKWNS